MSYKMLPHPPAAPLYRSLSLQLLLIPLLSLALLFDMLFPNQPTPDEDGLRKPARTHPYARPFKSTKNSNPTGSQTRRF